MSVMQNRSAIKIDLFARHQRAEQIDHLGDPLAQIEACIDFKALAAEIDRVAPRIGISMGAAAHWGQRMPPW